MRIYGGKANRKVMRPYKPYSMQDSYNTTAVARSTNFNDNPGERFGNAKLNE